MKSRLRFAALVTLCVASFACGPAEDEPAQPTVEPVSSDAEPISRDAETVEAETATVDTIRITFESVQEIDDFLERLSYTPQAWADGVRELPRMFVTDIGDRWRQWAQDELTVQAKKRIFFRAIAPLALRSNELISEQRDRLEGLPALAELTAEDRQWLGGLATDYRLEPPSVETEESWEEYRAGLLRRVDQVPVSLVLAQAADESGWGTSRFARDGNSLFGQWSFGGSGMLPEAQRKSLGNYGVAAFETPLLSVISYMRNLNSHPSYEDLRKLRSEARRQGEEPRGYDLAAGLQSYSERGQEYVDEIRGIMRVNRLMDADNTHLAPGPVYLVVPPDTEAP